MGREDEGLDEGARLLDAYLAEGSPYKVVRLEVVGKDLAIQPWPDYTPLHALAREKGAFHVVANTLRSGAYLYVRRLELTYFPPGTPRNDEFRYCLVKWEGLTFAVATIPARTRRFADRVAEKMGMRLSDGVPTMLGGGMPPRQFPLRGPNVWSLAGACRDLPQRPLMTGDDLAGVSRTEREVCRRLEDEFRDQHHHN
jgi:hypothetical protein